jgi:predicted AAA+ superfamily ATPase
MRKRYLVAEIKDLAFSDRKIALLSGPRQCGKTTLGQMLLRQRAAGAYWNWDDVTFRRLWARDPKAALPARRGKGRPLVVLDEIHKDRRWKGHLKGLFDTLKVPCDILVTGSARLTVYTRAKGTDSLLGRYRSFRLHPFSLPELRGHTPPEPDQCLDRLFGQALPRSRSDQGLLEDLLRYGPFPEPLLAQDERRARLWRRARETAVVREDLRDLTRIPELGRVELLVALLPGRVGSRFSPSAIREDLEVSFDTVRRWMALLQELYLVFEIKPFSRHIPRSLKREGKVYLWDYGGVPAGPARLENLVASHLLKACHYWTDSGWGDFTLHYLRTKDGNEIDFLIVRDGEPWLPVEVKSGDTAPSPQWTKFVGRLPCTRAVQITAQPGRRLHRFGPTELLVVGAAEAMRYLV